MQVGKLLKYLSGLSTITSDEPPVAKAEQLSNTPGITAYFQKLIGPEVTLNRLYYLSNVVVLIWSIITTLHLTTNPVVKSTTIPLMECSITAAMVKSTAGLPTKEKKKKTRKTKKTDCTAVVSTTPVVEHSINGMVEDSTTNPVVKSSTIPLMECSTTVAVPKKKKNNGQCQQSFKHTILLSHTFESHIYIQVTHLNRSYTSVEYKDICWHVCWYTADCG